MLHFRLQPIFPFSQFVLQSNVAFPRIPNVVDRGVGIPPRIAIHALRTNTDEQHAWKCQVVYTPDPYGDIPSRAPAYIYSEALSEYSWKELAEPWPANVAVTIRVSFLNLPSRRDFSVFMDFVVLPESERIPRIMNCLYYVPQYPHHSCAVYEHTTDRHVLGGVPLSPEIAKLAIQAYGTNLIQRPVMVTREEYERGCPLRAGAGVFVWAFNEADRPIAAKLYVQHPPTW